MGFMIIFKKFANLVPANRNPSPVIEAITLYFFWVKNVAKKYKNKLFKVNICRVSFELILFKIFVKLIKPNISNVFSLEIFQFIELK